MSTSAVARSVPIPTPAEHALWYVQQDLAATKQRVADLEQTLAVVRRELRMVIGRVNGRELDS